MGVERITRRPCFVKPVQRRSVAVGRNPPGAGPQKDWLRVPRACSAQYPRANCAHSDDVQQDFSAGCERTLAPVDGKFVELVQALLFPKDTLWAGNCHFS